MAGIAALAQEAGHRVTGSDKDVYPPMSDQLRSLGIEVWSGYDPAHLNPAPDCVVIGNVISRGNPAVEYVLDAGLRYQSGPEWLAEYVLAGRWVLAVAGTHGKTTTSSLLAHILEQAGLSPGFLIGGVPENFGTSARLGKAPFFVVEADEYDTAFFDKRAKFMHYRPRTAILNNLEFDHADIYPDLASIKRQFHHFVRTVPGSGLIVYNGGDQALMETLAMGCWTPAASFNSVEPQIGWHAKLEVADGSRFQVLVDGKIRGAVSWSLYGSHNVANGLAAMAAAHHAGVPVDVACQALAGFVGIKRRLECRGQVAGVTVYDDFAHHPTAITVTLQALRRRVGSARILALIELRSNTMRMGVHRNDLAGALQEADEVLVLAAADLPWDASLALSPLGKRVKVYTEMDQLLAATQSSARAGDHVLIMSNGAFGDIHQRLLDALTAREI